MERTIQEVRNFEKKTNKLQRQVRDLRQQSKATAQDGGYGKNSYKRKNRKRPDLVRVKYGQSAPEYYALLAKQANLAFLSSLLNPYEAAIERLPCAIPSAIPVPTTSVHFIHRTTVTVPSSGSIYVIWMMPKAFETNYGVGYLPNYLALSADGTVGTFYPTNTATTPVICSNKIYLPASSANKSRLVSAEMRISYVGKVVDQSGFYQSAVSFNSGVVTNAYNNGVNALGVEPPDWASLQQAPWYRIEPVTSGSLHTCLWVPTDYNDMNFYDVVDRAAGTTHQSAEFHDVQWNFQASGLTVGTKIVLEVASNWEVQLPSNLDLYARHQVLPSIDTKTANDLRLAVASRSNQTLESVTQAITPQLIRGEGLAGALSSVPNEVMKTATNVLSQYVGKSLGSAIGSMMGQSLDQGAFGAKQQEFYKLNSQF